MYRTNNSNHRIIWVDMVKFIAISLMVLGHSNLHNQPIHIFINAFHMPVFFFVSGLFIKEKSLSRHLRQDFKRLIQPYFICSILALSICWISPYMHPELYFGIDSFIDIFKNALVGIVVMDDNITPYSFHPYAPLWFLVALFICRFIFQLVLAIKKTYLNTLIFISVFFSIWLSTKVQGIRFYSLDAAFLSYPFLVFGYYLNKRQCIDILRRFYKVITIVTCVCLYVLSQLNQLVNVHVGDYGNSLLLFYVNALLGIILITSMSLGFKQDYYKKLSYIGANSFIVLITHGYILILSKVILNLLGYDLSNLPLIISLLMMVLVLAVSYYFVEPILKYMPAIVGKDKIIK